MLVAIVTDAAIGRASAQWVGTVNALARNTGPHSVAQPHAPIDGEARGHDYLADQRQ